MAPHAERRPTDDFVLTISDDEEGVPDLEFEDEAGESPDQSQVAGRKRKRSIPTSKQHVLKESSPKNKKSKHKRPRAEDQDDEAGFSETEEWTSRGRDDGTLNPDFEFSLGYVEGDFGEELDGWNLPVVNGRTQGSNKLAVSVDELVERRRAAKDAKRTNGDRGTAVDSSVRQDGDDIEVDVIGFDDQGEETLADDAFGMGALDDDDDDDAGDGSGGSDGGMVSPPNEESLVNEEHGTESDVSSVADPMPHPDDVMSSTSDNEAEKPEETARRNAFFAPEDSKSSTTAQKQGTFQGMSLSRPILRGLTAAGFTSPTPIQTMTVPVALLGKDVVGGAVTGSGKTAAFVIPILERLLFRPKRTPTTRVAILMPTRELAVQCFNVATKLASYTDITFARLVGGLSLREQEQELKKRPDIVIATPGRFIDHVRNTSAFAVESLEILVLDEADRMLDDGFADELDEILRLIPRSRQTMLFSATMTQDVDKLIRVGMNRPVRLMVDAGKRTVQGLVQEFVKLKGGSNESKEERRLAYLLHLCKNVYTSKTIVFLGSKVLAHRVKVLLSWEGVKAAELHGSMSQDQRLAAISSFRAGHSTHLLATDLASRGLDIPKVETVLNYTVPTTSTTYLHRVGRTARAGRAGIACTLFDSVAKASSSGKAAKASERTLLKPILKQAKSQSATIRTRTLPPHVIEELAQKIRDLQPEIEGILEDEKEERLLQQSERDITKGDNLVEHADEIASRPRRTWFQSEKDKKVASQLGMDERKGVAPDAPMKKDKKRKLSNNDKKKLKDRDERKGGSNAGWKKRSDERVGKGVLEDLKVSKASKKKSKAENPKRPAVNGRSPHRSKPKVKKTRH
ncbi:MAG: nucleolar DEAD-box protein required for synthesis of 60S ribosomal subunit [Chrysothrix sp. TS-e1954]|nr:MAG: nucleolar DEAD-box protein required for synthesis of 60S ribosomal subunit [Chrysothrix sp. TS-e1954]